MQIPLIIIRKYGARLLLLLLEIIILTRNEGNTK